MALFEPYFSAIIGLVEIMLGMLVFHRAMAAQMAPGMSNGLPIGKLLDEIRLSTFNAAREAGFLKMLIRLLLLPMRILWLFARDFLSRLMLFKFWALGFVLGSFGTGRAFGNPYLNADAWLFAIGHICLIFYVVLLLLHLSRLPQGKWWRNP